MAKKVNTDDIYQTFTDGLKDTGKAIGNSIVKNANPLISGIFGVGTSWLQNIFEGKRLEKTFELQEQAAQNNQQRAKEMWDYTNYENQVQHLKNAGLNPALLYGTSGGGGASTSGAGQNQGVGTMASQGIAMGVSIANALSQMRLQDAQAKKANAEANKISGVDTEEGKSRITLNTANAKLSESEISLNKTKEDLTNAQRWESEERTNVLFQDANLKFHEAQKMYHDARQSNVQADVMEATKQNLITTAINRNIIELMQIKTANVTIAEKQAMTSFLYGHKDYLERMASVAEKGNEINEKQVNAIVDEIAQKMEYLPKQFILQAVTMSIHAFAELINMGCNVSGEMRRWQNPWAR